MAAITGIVFVRKVNFSNAMPGGLIGEIWRIPASTAADTQTIVARYITNVLSVIGPVSFVALDGTATVPLITSVTVAASNFVDVLLLGTTA